MTKNQVKEVCARIKKARLDAGYSPEEMADLLELHVRSYQRFESEAIPFKYLMRIAEITGVSERFLLRGEVDEAQVLQELVALVLQLERASETTLQRIDHVLERLTRIEAGQLPSEERNRARHSIPNGGGDALPGLAHFLDDPSPSALS